MKIIFTYQNKKFKREIQYAAKVIFSIYDVDLQFASYKQLTELRDIEADTVISYGKRKPKNFDVDKHIHIYGSNLFQDDYLTESSLPDEPLERYREVPIIYEGEGPTTDWVETKKNSNGSECLETNIDIISSSFFMVTRYEEVINLEEDDFQRFPARASLAYRENFLHQPVVNQYMDLLNGWFEELGVKISQKQLWKKNFAVCLTHDVDSLDRYNLLPSLGFMETLFRLFQQGNVKRIGAILWDYFQTKLHLKQDVYYEAFDYIIDLEETLGFNSSFYFKSNNKDYSLDDPQFKEIIAKFKKKDFEVGIHPGFNSYNKPSILRKKRKSLEDAIDSKVAGGRRHYLKWKVPESYRAWESAGLKYDSSLGFADHEGFRCGICHPFKPFDVLQREVIDIWEIPLVVMDGTLFGYRELSPDEAYEEMVDLLDTVEKYSGVFVLLWHNAYMTDLFYPRWKAVFEEFYRNIAQRNCLVCTTKEIAEIGENKINY